MYANRNLRCKTEVVSPDEYNYMRRKWYGDDTFETMKDEGYVVDHMDNDGHNCCIDNLYFLIMDENKAKGMTLDKMSVDKKSYCFVYV